MSKLRLVFEASKVAELIGQPLADWPGNCMAVAAACYTKGLVPKRSRVCYGLYYGEIHPKSRFAGRGLCHHAWIELPDGRIYDPTQWPFTCADPHIWIGHGRHPFYDLGGSRQWKHVPPPSAKLPSTFKLSASKVSRLRRWFPVLQPDGPDQGQWYWLAHRHPDVLGEDTKWIYRELAKHELSALVPIDFRRYVFRVNPETK